MKTSFKVLSAIMGLGLVILLGLHFFLQYGLTKTMREVVLPRIHEETGVDVRVGNLSLNVPGGVLYLKDLEVKNPEGFLLENLASVGRVRVEVDIQSLLKRKPILVESIEVENALLNVVRNKEGEINLHQLQSLGAPPVEPTPYPEKPVQGGLPARGEASAATQPAESVPLPELMVEGMSCNAKVRYLDLRLNQLDVALDLHLTGRGLTTQQDPSLPWGDATVIGSLGDDRTRFITDLKISLAPVVDPQAPSFDLTGKVLEIDPRLLEEAYSKLGIRSAPFGLDPVIHCREGLFEDSAVALIVRDIKLEDKLSKKLGGMASIGSLRFAVPVEGTLQEPVFDLQSALLAALGGNTQTLLDAFLKGAAAREAGMEEPPESLADAAVEVLGAHVEEIGESEAAKQALKNLADGGSSDTNKASPLSSDTLVEILGEQVEEIGESEALKDELKNLGKKLFGR